MNGMKEILRLDIGQPMEPGPNPLSFQAADTRYYTSLANRVHVDIVGSQRCVLCESVSGHSSSPEVH
jgi:hypothetical protein